MPLHVLFYTIAGTAFHAELPLLLLLPLLLPLLPLLLPLLPLLLPLLPLLLLPLLLLPPLLLLLLLLPLLLLLLLLPLLPFSILSFAVHGELQLLLWAACGRHWQQPPAGLLGRAAGGAADLARQ
jgi:hypothetical protein